MRDSTGDAIRVAHVLAPAPVGGLEWVVSSLAIGLRARSHDVRVVAVVGEGADDRPFLDRLERSGVSVCEIAVPHRAYRKEYAAVRATLGRVDPDVVHTHGYRGDVLGGWAARSLGLPVVSTVHGFTRGGWKNRLYEWLQRRSLRRCEAVVAVSRDLARELVESGVPQECVHVEPNAWRRPSEPLARSEARARLGLEPEAFVVGWVGRLSSEKDPGMLVDAVDALPYDDVVAAVIGEGALSEALRRRAVRRGVEGRVRWYGRVEEASTLFRAFDVYALTSRTEGTPVALFEAMDAGVPIVATSVGGVPDVVGHGEALLVEPGDAAAFARGIVSVREDPDRARERARSALATLRDRYALEPWIDRYFSIYVAAAAATARSGR